LSTEDNLSTENNLRNEGGGAEVSLGRRFLNYRTLISFVIALGLLVVLFERLDVNFGLTWGMIKACNPVFYAFAFLSYYVTFPLRALRWRILLRSAGYRKEDGVALPSLWVLTQIILINWFGNSVIYGRLGDPYRAYLLKDAAANVTVSKSMGTVLAERCLDIIMVFILLMAAIFALLLTGGGGMTTAGIVMAVGSAMMLVVAILLGGMGRFGGRLEKRLPGKLRPLYSRFEEGTLASFHRLSVVGPLSILIWLLEAGRLALVVQALGGPIGFGALEVGVPVILFAALGNALITAIPLTPGGLGLVEPGVAGLLMIGPVSRGMALSMVLLDRTISFLSVIIVGLLVFLWWHFTQARRIRVR